MTPTKPEDALVDRLREEALWIQGHQGNVRGAAVMDEAADAITTLLERERRATEALKRAADAMTCGDDDDAHYCPKCDNTLYNARVEARAALTGEAN